MLRKIIGLVGPIASGKSMVADNLLYRGFKVEKLSNRVRDEATKRGLELTRDNLQNLGNELRESFGPGYLAELTIKMFMNTIDSLCLDGVRNPGEVEVIRKLGGHVIAVDSPVNLRLERYLKRSLDRKEDDGSERAFWVINNRDMGISESANGQRVSDCMELADFKINNVSTEADLLSQIDIILSEI